MEFITKMKEAMELLQEACSMNEEWANCSECPFHHYCDIIEQHGWGIPSDIEILE